MNNLKIIIQKDININLFLPYMIKNYEKNFL